MHYADNWKRKYCSCKKFTMYSPALDYWYLSYYNLLLMIISQIRCCSWLLSIYVQRQLSIVLNDHNNHALWINKLLTYIVFLCDEATEFCIIFNFNYNYDALIVSTYHELICKAEYVSVFTILSYMICIWSNLTKLTFTYFYIWRFFMQKMYRS